MTPIKHKKTMCFRPISSCRAFARHPCAINPRAIAKSEQGPELFAQSSKANSVLTPKKAELVTLSFSNINPASLGLPNLFGDSK